MPRLAAATLSASCLQTGAALIPYHGTDAIQEADSGKGRTQMPMSVDVAAGPVGHAHGAGHGEDASLFARRPVLTGVAVGVGSLAPHIFLPPQASLGFAALLIALIAGIYFGFAVMNGSPRDQFVEFNVTGMFAVTALLGLLVWPILLPLAYFGHALWDIAHHNRSRLSLVAIPQWYVPWCVVIDMIIGAGLLVIWTSDGII